MTRPQRSRQPSTRRLLSVAIDTGAGPVIILLAGFGMTPWLYRPTADLLGPRCRVVVPDIYRVRGPWRRDHIVNRLAATIADIGADHVTVIGHSFAGGIELAYATRFPERIRELVFADTLCASRELRLANEPMRHPLRLLWMATPSAARSFGRSAASPNTRPTGTVRPCCSLCVMGKQRRTRVGCCSDVRTLRCRRSDGARLRPSRASSHPVPA